MRYMIFLLYTQIPPLRPGEYACTRIDHDDKVNNYLDMASGRLTIRRQK